MTKKELLEAIAHVPDTEQINMAAISWGELDLNNPDQVNMYHYVNQELIKNVPDDIDLNNLIGKE